MREPWYVRHATLAGWLFFLVVMGLLTLMSAARPAVSTTQRPPYDTEQSYDYEQDGSGNHGLDP